MIDWLNIGAVKCHIELIYSFACQQIDWLIDWLIDRLIDRNDGDEDDDDIDDATSASASRSPRSITTLM